MPNWESQRPGDWGWPRGTAADIVAFTYAGHAFPGGVARLAAPLFRAALDRITGVPGFRLRESLGLDAGMWGYEDRRIGGSTNWSFHAFGLALDINAPDNPMSSATPPDSPYRLPMLTQALVRPLGLLWGGGPSGFGDWMHIEVHLSLAEASERYGDPIHDQGASTFPLPAGCYYGPYEGPNESISGSGRNDAQYRPGLQLAQRKLSVADDGYYGPVTAAATRQWQSDHQLDSDGLIGVLTWTSFGL